MFKHHRTQWGLATPRGQAWVFLLSLLMGLFLFGCDEAPFSPRDDNPVVKDYVVYFSDPTGTPQLFKFNPLTNAIDSADIPWVARSGVTVSVDGKRLYFGLQSSVVVVDTDSLSLIAELPFDPFTPVVVSPNNEYVAITGEDLYILRTSDYQIVFSDTDKTEYGHFSSDSKSFYCAGGWSSGVPGFVYKVDLAGDFTVQRKHFSQGGVFHVIPSIDEKKWFLYLNVGLWTSTFEVYDVQKDSIIFRQILVPGLGDLTMTPNGKKVFYTNPGSSGTDPPAHLGFTIFDVDANQIDRVMEDRDFFTGSTWVAPPNEVVVTPDGRWLAILGGSWNLTVLYLYDIEKGELGFREDFGFAGNHIFTNLSSQLWK